MEKKEPDETLYVVYKINQKTKVQEVNKENTLLNIGEDLENFDNLDSKKQNLVFKTLNENIIDEYEQENLSNEEKIEFGIKLYKNMAKQGKGGISFDGIYKNLKPKITEGVEKVIKFGKEEKTQEFLKKKFTKTTEDDKKKFYQDDNTKELQLQLIERKKLEDQIKNEKDQNVKKKYEKELKTKKEEIKISTKKIKENMPNHPNFINKEIKKMNNMKIEKLKEHNTENIDEHIKNTVLEKDTDLKIYKKQQKRTQDRLEKKILNVKSREDEKKIEEEIKKIDEDIKKKEQKKLEEHKSGEIFINKTETKIKKVVEEEKKIEKPTKKLASFFQGKGVVVILIMLAVLVIVVTFLSAVIMSVIAAILIVKYNPSIHGIKKLFLSLLGASMGSYYILYAIIRYGFSDTFHKII
jgi:hypothetical protein